MAAGPVTKYNLWRYELLLQLWDSKPRPEAALREILGFLDYAPAVTEMPGFIPGIREQVASLRQKIEQPGPYQEIVLDTVYPGYFAVGYRVKYPLELPFDRSEFLSMLPQAGNANQDEFVLFFYESWRPVKFEELTPDKLELAYYLRPKIEVMALQSRLSNLEATTYFRDFVSRAPASERAAFRRRIELELLPLLYTSRLDPRYDAELMADYQHYVGERLGNGDGHDRERAEEYYNDHSKALERRLGRIKGRWL